MKSIYFLSFNMISFVPYAFGFLKGFARQDPTVAAGYRWHLPLTTPQPVDDAVAAIQDPDLLCLSCYVWNHNQQMEVARRVKGRYPRCLVVCGGPHIPDRPDGFFSRHPQADVLVHGEGEIPFTALLAERLQEKPDYEKESAPHPTGHAAVPAALPPDPQGVAVVDLAVANNLR